MEDRRLKTFMAVAQHGSFSRAARALYVTQSTVTARIADLERELKTRLFVREGRGVALTEAGRLFLPYVQRCLQSLEDGRAALAAAAAGSGGVRLRIAASHVPAAHDLPHLLAELGHAHALLPVRIQTDSSKRIFRSMLRGETDVALVGVRFRHPEVETTIVLERPLALVRAARKTVSPGRPLEEESVFYLEEELEDALLVQSICHQFGLPAAEAVGVRDLHVLLEWVRHGLGIGLVPRQAVARELEEGTLEELPGEVNGALPRQIVCLMVRKEARSGPAGPLLHRFQEVCHRYYARLRRAHLP